MVTKWRPCPSLEWPNHNLTVYKLNLATERVKNKGQNVGNIKQPTFFSLSLRKIQLQHLDKTLASKSWQNFSIKFGPKFSKLFGLARSCKERQGGVSWLLERLRESPGSHHSSLSNISDWLRDGQGKAIIQTASMSSWKGRWAESTQKCGVDQFRNIGWKRKLLEWNC